MKPRLSQSSVAFSVLLNAATASTLLQVYSDSSCQGPALQEFSGPEDGTCTSFGSTFGSFKLTSISPGHSVTVYATTSFNCGPSDDNILLNLSICYNRTNVDQFTIDPYNFPGNGSSTSQATFITSTTSRSSPTEVTATSASATPSGSAQSVKESPSLGTAAIVGIAVPLGVAFIAAVVAIVLGLPRAILDYYQLGESIQLRRKSRFRLSLVSDKPSTS